MTDPSDSSDFVGGLSTSFSTVRAGAGQASEPSSSSARGVGSSSVSTPSTSGPSEGGIHGWWKAGESSPSLSSH